MKGYENIKAQIDAEKADLANLRRESARLRERVAELERRDEVAGIGFKSVAQELQRLTERERLLLEAVRWLFRHTPLAWVGEDQNQLFDLNNGYKVETPNGVGPLIAEAVKEQGNG